MKLWPWSRNRTESPSVPQGSDEARAALERAKRAENEALRRLGEMTVLADELRSERDRNHFAPTIYNAMKRRSRRD